MLRWRGNLSVEYLLSFLDAVRVLEVWVVNMYVTRNSLESIDASERVGVTYSTRHDHVRFAFVRIILRFCSA